MSMEHVPGRKNGEVVLYALSTCVWCGKTRELLTELGVEYSYVYVDLLSGAEFDRTVAEMARWNKSRSFPTLVINNSKVIVGFREDEIREVLA
ncbi:glutaredoxin family protein [Methanocella arvoryzae]|uniref:Glutaredoxin-like protein n=1 Tax=Methanocella arvoryzae (strain DSM 22066 / NBRC 105507 / MRE50) TaxID=351160 RepID=Q0W246_METAR|nr:glutaredoxin family protein [Methanocella arvoryzae]CAJ37547.1 glutaredoxin-like protein [Methanocella arvoryzae MRE50]